MITLVLEVSISSYRRISRLDFVACQTVIYFIFNFITIFICFSFYERQMCKYSLKNDGHHEIMVIEVRHIIIYDRSLSCLDTDTAIQKWRGQTSFIGWFKPALLVM